MFKLTTIIGTFAMLCAAAPAISAPNLDTFRKQLDTFVETQMHTQKVPGIAIAVLRNGKIVVAKGYGWANVELNVPVTTETMFQSGSVGKMFTAAAVMTAVEQGKMDLNDPVSKYLPDAPASWHPITIRQMLTHTSGLPNAGADFDLRRDYTDDELVKTFYPMTLDFEPGARWSYSNTGYQLLGILVKKATGQSYLDILGTHVFKPLGMKTARAVNDADIVPNRSAGYQLVDGELKNQDWVSMFNPTGDGSLYLSLDDMIAWARGVEKGAALSSNSWKQIYTPVRLNSGKPYPYGFGWFLDEAGGHPRYYHSGSWQGFRTFYSRYLGDDLSVILLANSADTNTYALVDGIAALWDPTLTAPGPRPSPDPEADRSVTALIGAARAGTLRHQDVPLASPAALEESNQYFMPLLKRLGPLTKLELTDRREVGDDTVFSYAATFGARTIKVSFARGPGEQLSNFSIDD